MYGPLDSSKQPIPPAVTHFTRVSTYLIPEKLEKIFTFPTTRKVRLLCQPSNPLLAVGQVAPILRLDHVKEYEIVICSKASDIEYNFVIGRMGQLGLDQDSRVTVHQHFRYSWVDLVSHEYVDRRESFINSL